jgi:hypothetical protein
MRPIPPAVLAAPKNEGGAVGEFTPPLPRAPGTAQEPRPLSPFHPIVLRQVAEFGDDALVDPTLERHGESRQFFEGSPSPRVELRMTAGIEVDVGVGPI